MTVKLKGITLPAVGAGYPNIDNFKLFEVMNAVPVPAGLVGAYFLGSKNADPTYNFANPSLPLLRKLQPDESSTKHARLSHVTGYYDTQLIAGMSATYIALIRQQPEAITFPVVTSYSKATGAPTGDSHIVSRAGAGATSSVLYTHVAAGVTSVSCGMNGAIAPGEYYVIGANINNVTNISKSWGLTEVSGPGYSQVAIVDRKQTANPLLIGTTYSDTEFLNPTEIAAVLIYDRDVGDVDMKTLMKWLRNTVGIQAGIWSTVSPRP